MPKVFISYARDGSHGQNLAGQAQQRLQIAGFEVFRDVIGLKPGDIWYHKLEFELKASDCMVLVVSEKIRESKWVHNEVSMAEEIGIPVIPLLAEKILKPLWLRHLQALNFCEAADWPVLIESVGSAAVKPGDSENVAVEGQSVIDQAQRVSATDQPEKHKLIVGSLLLDRFGVNNAEAPSGHSQNTGLVIPWASGSGQDQYGQYADLTIKTLLNALAG